MAADRYLLERTVLEQRPIVRFYRWEHPTISLGQAQRFNEIFAEDAILRDGIDRIVRPTGGRAVFHSEDLTYAIAFPVGFPGMGATVNDTYAVIADCFRIGFSLAGIDVGLETVSRTGEQLRSEVRLPDESWSVRLRNGRLMPFCSTALFHFRALFVTCHFISRFLSPSRMIRSPN